MASHIDQHTEGIALGSPKVMRTFAADEILFKAGDPKTSLYRVESGVVCLYETKRGADPVFVDFVFAGEFMGFGFLNTHISTARAMTETRVSSLPLSSALEIVGEDSRAASKLAVAIDREFEARRDLLVDAGQAKPIERVASLLVNLSCSNGYEGRDPLLITDAWDCGTIADFLDLSVGDLADMLIDLEDCDLIKPDSSGGLRIVNIEALETLADEPWQAPSRNRILNGQRARPPKLPPQWSAAA